MRNRDLPRVERAILKATKMGRDRVRRVMDREEHRRHFRSDQVMAAAGAAWFFFLGIVARVVDGPASSYAAAALSVGLFFVLRGTVDAVRMRRSGMSYRCNKSIEMAGL